MTQKQDAAQEAREHKAEVKAEHKAEVAAEKAADKAEKADAKAAKDKPPKALESLAGLVESAEKSRIEVDAADRAAAEALAVGNASPMHTTQKEAHDAHKRSLAAHVVALDTLKAHLGL